jgi:hypothetical protein
MALNFAAIHFFVDNAQFAYRNWNFVPREGDEVVLGEGASRGSFTVKLVVWGNDAPDPERGAPQRVNILLQRVDKKVVRDQVQLDAAFRAGRKEQLVADARLVHDASQWKEFLLPEEPPKSIAEAFDHARLAIARALLASVTKIP